MKLAQLQQTIKENSLAIIAVGIGLILVRSLVRNFSATSQARRTARAQAAAQNEILRSCDPSYPQAFYDNAANELEQHMRGVQLFKGRQWSNIERVLNRMNNLCDFAKLDNAFGIRSGETLGHWFMDDNQADNVAQYMNNRNIPYTFKSKSF